MLPYVIIRGATDNVADALHEDYTKTLWKTALLYLL